MPSRRHIAKPLPVGPYDESQLWKLPYGSEMNALQMGLSRVSVYNDAVSRANKLALINATTSGLSNAAYAILDSDSHLLSPITLDAVKRLPRSPFAAVPDKHFAAQFNSMVVAFPQDGSLHPYGVPARYVPIPGGQRLYHMQGALRTI